MRNRRISHNMTAAESTNAYNAATSHTAEMEVNGTAAQLADAKFQEFKALNTMQAITQTR